MLLAAALDSPAQNAPAALSSAQVNAQWSRISQYEFAPVAPAANGASSPAVAVGNNSGPAGSPIAAAYLQRADEIDGFCAQNPGFPQLGEARRLEALMLVNARYNGLDSIAGRCDALVQSVRQDTTLSQESRFQLASLADLRAARVGGSASMNDLLAAVENTARALIQEFPNAPSAYESLLRIADDNVDAACTRIAQDLLKMPAPQNVGDGARRLLDRYALVGQPLAPLLGTALASGTQPGFRKNHMAVLYTWSTVSEGLTLGQQIAAAAPQDATIVGLNLNTDVASARKVAGDNNLPGIQIYGSAGLDPSLAGQRQLIGHDFVIVAARNGVITSVSARVDLAAKILAANQ